MPMMLYTYAIEYVLYPISESRYFVPVYANNLSHKSNVDGKNSVGFDFYQGFYCSKFCCFLLRFIQEGGHCVSRVLLGLLLIALFFAKHTSLS